MENKIFFARFLCVTLVHINNRVESWIIFLQQQFISFKQEVRIHLVMFG